MILKHKWYWVTRNAGNGSMYNLWYDWQKPKYTLMTTGEKQWRVETGDDVISHTGFGFTRYSEIQFYELFGMRIEPSKKKKVKFAAIQL